MTNSPDPEPRHFEWMEYYKEFTYFSPKDVRDGCHPRIMLHAAPARNAIVLVHGLSDSPHFVSSIGQHFHEKLGFDVYLPLLQCHGLREPRGMETVDLAEWKRNVRFAMRKAQERSERISIGGLSTGGTLSFYMAATKPAVNGDLYLFSAALDLAGGHMGLLGELKERVLRTFLADILDQEKPLVGSNPYRYSHIDMDAAQELAYLIKETDDLIDGFDHKCPFPRRIFIAHSESDSTADISGVENLCEKVSGDESLVFYRIPESRGVSHASLVLKDPIRDNGKILEAENPLFEDMMKEAGAFALKHGPSD